MIIRIFINIILLLFICKRVDGIIETTYFRQHATFVDVIIKNGIRMPIVEYECYGLERRKEINIPIDGMEIGNYIPIYVHSKDINKIKLTLYGDFLIANIIIILLFLAVNLLVL